MQCLNAPRRALTAALLSFVISTWSATAHAGPYEDGMAALDRWDATRAAAFFEIAAQKGDPRGLYEFAIHATGGPSDDELLYLERAVALGEPRAMAWLAAIQLRAVPGGSGRARAFPEPPSRVPRLLATACERQQFDACMTLARLHAGWMPEWAKHVGITDVDMDQARRWGDLWRAGRLAEARTGDETALAEIIGFGAEAWSGVDAATQAFHRVVYVDMKGDASSGPGGPPPDAALRSRVDAWEIEQGLRPARLPDALTLARRIAAFEAANDQFDTETIAAFGRYVAAEAMAAASDPYAVRRPWGGELGKVTAVATREMAVFHKHFASTHRKLGLDIETWLPGRLVATFSRTQLYWMDRMRSTPGMKKRAAVARLLRIASLDGDAVTMRLQRDPAMESLGQDEIARRDRYAKDRGIELGPAAEPILETRERLLSALMQQLHLGERNARLGHAAWSRASAMLTLSEARDIARSLVCGHCRGVENLLQELMSERAKVIETAQAAARMEARVTGAIQNWGTPPGDR